MSFDIDSIRSDFPILSRKVHGKQLVYFDNGATTQKPTQVINRIVEYYEKYNSNVHRGTHYLSQISTEFFEEARSYIADFINAGSHREVIFTKGTTEAINLVASSFDRMISANNEVVITAMEHHSNLVPWQQLCERNGAKLRVVPILEDGSLNLEELKAVLSKKTKLVAIAHISNVLGTINPVKEIISLAHELHIPVMIDGAQAIAHVPVNVREIDCEFYAFSAHKAYGPMGMGVLYGKEEWLNKLKPYQFGGEMISTVSFNATTFNELPYRFEAGTPDVAGVLGMETALRYIEKVGITDIQIYEDELLEYATNLISDIDGVNVVGTAKNKTSVLSLKIDGVHPFDIGTLMDQLGIAIRTGNHCAQPLMEMLNIPGTLRASLAMYNTRDEIDIFVGALVRALSMLK